MVLGIGTITPQVKQAVTPASELVAGYRAGSNFVNQAKALWQSKEARTSSNVALAVLNGVVAGSLLCDGVCRMKNIVTQH